MLTERELTLLAVGKANPAGTHRKRQSSMQLYWEKIPEELALSDTQVGDFTAIPDVSYPVDPLQQSPGTDIIVTAPEWDPGNRFEVFDSTGGLYDNRTLSIVFPSGTRLYGRVGHSVQLVDRWRGYRFRASTDEGVGYYVENLGLIDTAKYHPSQYNGAYFDHTNLTGDLKKLADARYGVPIDADLTKSNCGSFNGTTSSVAFSVNGNADTFDITVSFKTSAATGDAKTILDCRNSGTGYVIYLAGTDHELIARFNNGSGDKDVSGGTGLDDGSPHVIQYTYDGAQCELFVDGTSAGTVAATGSVSGTNNFKLGAST